MCIMQGSCTVLWLSKSGRMEMRLERLRRFDVREMGLEGGDRK
jgi:hypothetical protein